MDTRQRLQQRSVMPNGAGRLWLAARVTVAVGFAAFGVLSFRYSLRILRADVVSETGFRASKRPEMATVALAEFRRAQEIAPHVPLNQFRLANQILQVEAQRYTGRREINLDNLNEGLALLKAALPGFHKKQLIFLRSGEVRVIFADYFRSKGDAAGTQQYAGLAADDLIAYRNIQGRPEIDPATFYGNAIKSANLYGRPQLALRLLDDYVRYFGAEAVKDAGLLESAITSRQLMGEFPFMMEELGTLARLNPESEWVASFIDRAARLMGQREAAMGIFRDLERRDLLKGRLAALRENLK